MTAEELALAVLGQEGQEIAAADIATASFIGLGGDSLRALRLAALALAELGVRIPLTELLGDEPLAAVLAAARPARPDEAGQRRAQGPVDSAVTAGQRGMWLHEEAAGGTPYNLVFLCLVTAGRLDPGLLEQVLGEVTARHDGLRTVFRERDGAVRREILEPGPARLALLADDCPAGGFAGRARAAAAEFGRRPFDVSAAPAVRFLLVTGAEGQALVLAAHHMMLDGRAVGLLLREIFTRYASLAAGTACAAPVPGVPLSALARHQDALRAAGEWDRQARLLAGRLAGVPAVLELPSDRPRSAAGRDATGERLPVDLGPAVSGAVTACARALGSTPFAVLLGAFALTLSRHAGARHLLVGVPVAGRGTPELAGLVAYAGNLVPVRVDVDDDGTAAGYLRGVHRSLAVSIEAADLPFEELVARLGISRGAGHPLVQACFGMHDQLIPASIEAGPLRVSVEECHGGGSQFDLSLLIGRAEPSLAGHAEYATSVWSAAEAAGFADDFCAAAGELAAAAGTGTRLEEVRCISPARQGVLDRLNETGRDFPATSLDELFRDAARRWPDTVAVRDEAVQLTYAQLRRAAARQARLLREAGVTGGDRVLIGVERSAAEAVAVLGTAWAGAAYVGIDLSQPAAHIAKIVARAAPAAVIAGTGPAGALAAHGIPVVPAWTPDWPAGLPAGTGPDGAGPAPARDPGRLAYVAFTSGSTGEPKGVAVPHRAVIRLVHQAGYVRLGPGERVLRLSPLAFDASTLELWGALLTGATLEAAPPGLLSPSELGDVLTGRQVTVAWLTAGLFRLVEELAPDSLRGLRQLLTGGDVVPHEHAARALARHPGLVITNGYGPTENTTFTTTYSVARPEDIDGPLPIGTPVPGTRVYVLDDRGRPVPPGGVGELYAAGEGLADGYLGDDAETARCFGRFSPAVPERLYRIGDLVRLDSRGRLRFLGRSDDQVKVRGFRIELSAISGALTACPGVRDAVVTVTGGDSADKRLLAAVTLEPGAGVIAADLRDSLSARLPSYMVPTLWAIVDRIPVTENGKTDRRALAAAARPAVRRPGPPAPGAGSPGQQLAEVLALFGAAVAEAGASEAAGLTPESDFFTAGGTSLAAVRLIGTARERFGVTLRMRDFLLAPTPEGLHRLVASAARKQAGVP